MNYEETKSYVISIIEHATEDLNFLSAINKGTDEIKELESSLSAYVQGMIEVYNTVFPEDKLYLEVQDEVR